MIDIPIIGRILFSHTVFFYLAVLIAIAMYLFLK